MTTPSRRRPAHLGPRRGQFTSQAEELKRRHRRLTSLIRHLRIEQGLSVAQLHHRLVFERGLPVSYEFVKRIDLGKTRVPSEAVVDFAEVLRVPVRTLLETTYPERPPPEPIDPHRSPEPLAA